MRIHHIEETVLAVANRQSEEVANMLIHHIEETVLAVSTSRVKRFLTCEYNI